MDDTYRVVILGPSNTGKRFLATQIVYGDPDKDPDEESLNDSIRKSIMLDDAKVTFELLDTSGTETFPAMHDLYIKSGDGFLLVFNINSIESFCRIDEYYELIVRVRDTNNFLPIILVGNSTDDTKSSRQVSVEEGEQKARLWSIEYMETILLTNYNVNKVFLQLLRKIRANKQQKHADKPKTE
ncbi:unnamed protein product, partial [Rotaria sp. Silwood2]